MKQILILLIVIIISLNTKSFGQWEAVYCPFFDTLNYSLPFLTSVAFVNANNGIAVGYAPQIFPTIAGNGIILKTNDGGYQWDTIFYFKDSTSFLKVTIINDNTVFVAGNNNFFDNGYVLKSMDFGSNWDTTIFSKNISSIHFPNDTIGYIVGKDGLVFKTTDGGNNWLNLSPDSISNYTSVFFINDTIVFGLLEYNFLILLISLEVQFTIYKISSVLGLLFKIIKKCGVSECTEVSTKKNTAPCFNKVSI